MQISSLQRYEYFFDFCHIYFANRTNFYIFVKNMSGLYIFNADNDMALAHNEPYYVAPAKIRKMMADLADLPRWYADMNAEGVHPWGWSRALVNKLEHMGLSCEELPNDEWLQRYRQLSSRATAVNLLGFLRCITGTCGISVLCKTCEEVMRFVRLHQHVIMKAPWSGSGKGLQQVHGIMTPSVQGWMNRIMNEQGAVVCEPLYNKVCDFAMEFIHTNNEMRFAGYSLFETDGSGKYKENVLASDNYIADKLKGYGIPLDMTRTLIARLLGSWLQGIDTPLGVDMMVCDCGGELRLHPCVEINLRMNMGLLSRIYFDRHCEPHQVGRLVVEYYPERGMALCEHERMGEKDPTYRSLTKVNNDTQGQVYVSFSN